MLGMSQGMTRCTRKIVDLLSIYCHLIKQQILVSTLCHKSANGGFYISLRRINFILFCHENAISVDA